ncbi:MAG TPA: metal-sensitive transcriptional regulator [Dehalococcoidia bacterium]|nr:metal-sensitive transcriptional regulator [Dehalococcoidia bacterium]
MVRQQDDTAALLSRLRRIEGQVRGIHRMLEEGRVCEDLLTQLLAARSGLDQVSLLVLERHVDNCVLADLPDETRKSLEQALRHWLRFGSTAPQDDAPLPAE